MNKKSQEKKIIYCILLRLTHRRRAVSQAIEILLEIYIYDETDYFLVIKMSGGDQPLETSYGRVILKKFLQK